MKKILASLLVGGFIACAAPAFAYQGIDDVAQNYWAQPEIASVVSDSVMTLTGSNFNPEGKMSRVEFVKALLKVLGNDDLEIKTKLKFSDVKKSSEDYAPIARSQQLGLVYGYPDGTFKPDANVTRAEFAAMAIRALGQQHTKVAQPVHFSDITEDYWAYQDIQKALYFDLISCDKKGELFRPEDSVSRAESLSVAVNALIDWGDRVAQKMALLRDKSVMPPQSHVVTTAGQLAQDAGISGFTLMTYSIRGEYAKIIDEYFTCYGYICRRVKVPAIANRVNHNYVKTIGSNITGTAPADDIQLMNAAFDKGITIWHCQLNQIGDYSKPNGGVG